MPSATSAPVAYRWNGSSWDVVSLSAVPDAIAVEAIRNIASFTSWLAAGNAKGIIGEIGWPNAQHNPGDVPQWNATAHLVLSYLDAAGLDFLIWQGDNSRTSGGASGPYVLAIYYTGLTPGDNLLYAGTQAPVASYHYPLGTFRRGVNAANANAGAEPGVDGVSVPVSPSGYFSSANPGVPGVDYWYPSDSDFSFYSSQGVRTVCVRFRWERLQPVPGGALASGELAAIRAMLASAAAHGVNVALEPHNGHGYILGTSPTSFQAYPVSQAGTITVASFVNLWTRLSAALAGRPNLVAYGLVNEPTFPSCGIPSGPNLVPNGSFASNIAGWSANNPGSTVAWVASPAMPGTTGSMAITATASASPSVVPSATSGYVIPVTAGSSYQAECWFLAGSPSLREFCRIQVNFHDALGRFVGSGVSDVSTFDSDLQWQYASSAVTVPPGAVMAAVTPFFPGVQAGEVHYVSSVSLRACTSPMTGTQLWQSASQQVVSALRAQGDSTECWVESARNTGPQDFATWNAAPWITDPAGNVRYDAHMYLDYAEGASGLYLDSYAAEVAAALAAGF